MNIEFKDIDNSVFEVMRQWNEIINEKNEKSPPNPLDIKIYIRDKWWKKIIPTFIYSLLFKPNTTFKNCYPSSLDFDFVQQPLHGSPEGSPKSETSSDFV